MKTIVIVEKLGLLNLLGCFNSSEKMGKDVGPDDLGVGA